ncbi:MAG: murein biosynthesis integral membrane protein MurJ [Planctomycetota bacterium]
MVEERGEAAETPPRRSLIGRARGLAGLILLSRLLGVVREQFFARLFGSGLHADALVVAFRLPNLLRDLVAEGALSGALVPSLSQTRKESGAAGVNSLTQALLTRLSLLTGTLSILGIIFAPALIDLFAGGFLEGPAGAEKRAETIRLTRILFPFLWLASLAGVARSVLNLEQRFRLPALAPPAANLLAIVVGGALLLSHPSGSTSATAWALALLGGGALSFLIQLPVLRRGGLSLRPSLRVRHPGLRGIYRRLLYAGVAAAAVQVNILVGTSLAAFLEEGSVSALNYAFRLIYLPIGLVGVVIAAVSTVDLNHRIAGEDRAGASTDLEGALRLAVLLSLPSAVGLWILAEPVVRLIYEYGSFTPADTARVAIAVQGYGVGLLFYSLAKVLSPACTAVRRERAPAVAAVLSCVGYVICAQLTYREHGVLALALAASVAAVLNCTMLLLVLRRELGPQFHFFRGISRAALLTLAMAPVCHWTCRGLDRLWGSEGFLARLGTVGGTVVAGAIIVLGGGLLLRVPEARELLRIRSPKPEPGAAPELR